jgi:hypothetical protein
MRSRERLKVRTVAYFFVFGIAALGAPVWAKVLRIGAAGWSAWSLAGYFAFFLVAAVFLWAALRALARLKASDPN